jgi:hypothetical protein
MQGEDLHDIQGQIGSLVFDSKGEIKSVNDLLNIRFCYFA